MKIIQLFTILENKGRLIKILIMPLLLVMMGGVFMLVYYTGGIKYVYSHSMYIPILLGALIYGVRGGILFGILGGLTLGPFMPINVATGEMQDTINWLYRTGFFVLIGSIVGLASHVSRIYSNKLKWIARHDEYTGLPNRHALIEDLPNYATDSHSPSSNILLVASVYNTRQLKTAFGIDVVDTAIAQISDRYAKRLKEMGHNFRIYRADAGSISTLLTNTPSQKIKALLTELANVAKRPFEFRGIPLHVDFRIGFVPFESVSNAPHSYLHYAESAMNQAHESMKDFLGYSEDWDTLVRKNMSLLGELVDAIELKQLALHYQPKIDTKTGNVVGVEGLMRWNHPTRGNVPPDVFIPCAEQSTLIFDITKFALETALQQIVHWNKKGIDLPISVNVSPHNLGEPGFSDVVIKLLEQFGVDGYKLELEVTENALMLDIDTSTKELKKLADKGVIISVDDFGTGYCSLQYLDKLPISTIKIDQSFIRQLSDHESSSHIVEAIIELSHRLKIKVIAEGVEDQDTFDYLFKNGCDYIQGYFFSRPLAERDFEEWIKYYESSDLVL